MVWGERKWEMDCFAESQSTFLEMLPVSSICAKIFSIDKIFLVFPLPNIEIKTFIGGWRNLASDDCGNSRQGCRNRGGRGCTCPSRFWYVRKPISTRGHIMSTTSILAPKIFRPSYGPVEVQTLVLAAVRAV